MLIEFSGIDGAGKTTLTELTMRLFNSASVPCYQRSMVSTYKRVAADLAKEAGHSHWSGLFCADEIEVAQAFEMLSLSFQHIRPLDLDSQVIVTDAYVSHWLATALLWESSAADRLAVIYSRLPTPDLSIDLRVPLEVAQQRIRERRKGDHVLKMGPNSVLPRFAVAYDRARGLVPYPQATVSTDGSLDETWQRVKELILEYVRASGRHTSVLEAARAPVGRPSVGTRIG
jgi:thymidylate kinase